MMGKHPWRIWSNGSHESTKPSNAAIMNQDTRKPHAYFSSCSLYEIACNPICAILVHDDTIKWKHFLHYWPFVWGIHLSPVNSPHKGQWCWTLMFSLICAWRNSWVNNCDAGDLRPHCTHYDATVMWLLSHHVPSSTASLLLMSAALWCMTSYPMLHGSMSNEEINNCYHATISGPIVKLQKRALCCYVNFLLHWFLIE